jgi:hypothetical protein
MGWHKQRAGIHVRPRGFRRAFTLAPQGRVGARIDARIRVFPPRAPHVSERPRRARALCAVVQP